MCAGGATVHQYREHNGHHQDGLKRNGSLLYTICPIQLALDQFYEQQLTQMDAEAERQRVAKALALRRDKCSSA